jgi:hypothetical protein
VQVHPDDTRAARLSPPDLGRGRQPHLRGAPHGHRSRVARRKLEGRTLRGCDALLRAPPG